MTTRKITPSEPSGRSHTKWICKFCKLENEKEFTSDTAVYFCKNCGKAEFATTKCPKIGQLQWSCTYEECICHLKANIKQRK